MSILIILSVLPTLHLIGLTSLLLVPALACIGSITDFLMVPMIKMGEEGEGLPEVTPGGLELTKSLHPRRVSMQTNSTIK